jgi:DNA polymerase III delta prime subunit
MENVTQYDNAGLEALIFTADGDMRTAINNLQSTLVGNIFFSDQKRPWDGERRGCL